MMERRAFLGFLGAAYVSMHTQAATAVAAAIRDVSPDVEKSVRDEAFWYRVRQAFSIDENQINFNSGSVSPAPRVVQAAMEDYLTIMNMSPSLYVGEMLTPQLENVRRRLAMAFGCDTEEIAVTRNTSEALENVILGIDLEPGDEVLTTNQDYISMLWSWQQRERRDGIVLKTVPFATPPPSMEYLVEQFERAVTPRTRVIMVSHVTYTTGQVFPVRAICDMARERGIQTVVDGAHGFAHFPFMRDDLNCDYYGTSLHKWLTAPIGTGFLYVRKDRIADVWPLMPAHQDKRNDIRKFEAIGTYPVAAKNAITAALNFQESIGAERKAARLHYLRERWSRRVETLPGVNILNSYDIDQACGIGAMSIDGIDAQKLSEYLLAEHEIHVRARIVPNEYSAIRIAPNVFSTLEEIDTFSAAIEKVVRTGI